MLTVAVTGMNARPDNPGPGLAVARCIREAPFFRGRMIGLGYDAIDPGLYLSRDCDAGYLLPYPSAGEAALVDRLLMIHERERIDVLVPCLDTELLSMIRLQPLLVESGIRMFLPSTEQIRMRSKAHLNELASLAGISSPETRSISDAGFFYTCQEDGWHYPLVVKGPFYDAGVASNAEEGTAIFRRIAAQWGLPILVQRFVKGEECNLTGLGDGEGNLLGPVMMKKFALTEKGKAWAGVSIADDTLLDAAASLVKALKWRGPLEVEVIRDPSGQYQLIEMNPRFPAWIYLSAGVGRNLPAALVQLAQGLIPGPFRTADVGTLFVRYADEVIVPIREFESLVMQGERRGDVLPAGSPQMGWEIVHRERSRSSKALA